MQARLRERFLSKRLNLRLLPSRRGKTQIRVPVSRGYMDSSVQTNCEGLSVRYIVPLVRLLARTETGAAGLVEPGARA